jgi:hypothetical protein
MTNNEEKIVCSKCKHFYVTWDKDFPHGCTAMGFKSKNLPSLVAFQCSQIACQHFEPKK